MLLDARDLQRRFLCRIQVDRRNPPATVPSPAPGCPEISLNWNHAWDQQGHLRRCPLCGCRELFVRKDFPQKIGLSLVIAAGVLSFTLFAFRWLFEAFLVLVSLAVVDAAIYLFTPRCLVCYRCRSEFRQLPIPRDHPTWDLATGEKYRNPSHEISADSAA